MCVRNVNCGRGVGEGGDIVRHFGGKAGVFEMEGGSIWEGRREFLRYLWVGETRRDQFNRESWTSMQERAVPRNLNRKKGGGDYAGNSVKGDNISRLASLDKDTFS